LPTICFHILYYFVSTVDRALAKTNFIRIDAFSRAFSRQRITDQPADDISRCITGGVVRDGVSDIVPVLSRRLSEYRAPAAEVAVDIILCVRRGRGIVLSRERTRALIDKPVRARPASRKG
jgi:hypothetical protein